MDKSIWNPLLYGKIQKLGSKSTHGHGPHLCVFTVSRPER